VEPTGLTHIGNTATANNPVALSPPVTSDLAGIRSEHTASSLAIGALGGSYTPAWNPSPNAATRLQSE
jgi:hypothetical protein